MKFLKTTLTLLVALLSFSTTAETVTYFINDVSGSPMAAMDKSGNILWRESYDPYGDGRKNPSQNYSDVGFTGHQKDDVTGLTYMQARYYDPVIGRFMGGDPVDNLGHMRRGNLVLGFGKYPYVNNNPYKYVDPDGEFGLLGAAVGAAIGGLSSIAVQSLTGDRKINWSTVGAAILTGAAVGATGGLAGAAVAKIGLTGAEAAATVLIPSATVAAVGGGVTQMVENTANGDPLNKGVALSAGAAAVGTVLGGVTGDKIVGAVTKSNVLGEAGKLAGGKATGEAIATVTQEGITQGITNGCTSEVCE
ncbi:RHS repeat-associated core domain-containing protein [Aliikangiella sp. G2MR2-5]|uniref:RHS repeat-associated core domain-containing protein n=1 Tax=Aliikangiella sp. G2MR2-5 TaxID=2788943 RepID=UPI0018A8ABE0|nr:RHS repeat-associated core domain-containing protein [Aliikangiella sp. G2MR2-5]